jgi:tight adherence protein C
MLLPLIALIVVLVVALAAAVHVLLRDRERGAVLGRAGAGGMEELIALKVEDRSLGARLTRWLVQHAPSSWKERSSAADQLVHAGFDSAAAPVVYTVVRLACAIALPLLAFTLVDREDLRIFVLGSAIACIVGFLLPPALLSRQARMRQEHLRRSLPDSLDLLVVCVEAGISLDAAILRVAREMAIVHPELADELMVVNRRVNAGVPRDQALHGLWTRTGVEELRALAANMIQSEKWGTSIATVLRVYAEASRRKRKQIAEKKAATAPLKMLFPMAVFIFPSLFIVLLGPAIINISAMFRDLHR